VKTSNLTIETDDEKWYARRNMTRSERLYYLEA
jgi:hypothetical protein